MTPTHSSARCRPNCAAPGTALFDAFASRYNQYVEQVVVPTVAAFRSCTALVVLVDVTMLLAGGVGMYDDNRQIVRDLFDVLGAGREQGVRAGGAGAEQGVPAAPVAAGVDHAGGVRAPRRWTWFTRTTATACNC